MRLKIGTLLTLTLLIFSCQNEKPTINSIIGPWESIGSGWILDIKDRQTFFRIVVYDLETDKQNILRAIENL